MSSAYHVSTDGLYHATFPDNFSKLSVQLIYRKLSSPKYLQNVSVLKGFFDQPKSQASSAVLQRGVNICLLKLSKTRPRGYKESNFLTNHKRNLKNNIYTSLTDTIHNHKQKMND